MARSWRGDALPWRGRRVAGPCGRACSIFRSREAIFPGSARQETPTAPASDNRMTAPAHSAWRVPIRVNEIPEGGRHLDLHADAGTREAIARMASVEALPRLDASFDVTRHGGEGVRVRGTVSASVRQACVVTLEPLESEVEEAVDLVFAPAVRPDVRRGDSLSAETVALAADEPPEALGETIDLGEIATEFLLLAIDPYPRKPGAVFAASAPADDSAHPFAALAALKKGKAEE
jgi:uncharacterized metal-binding protein YceD (DUF177 family)